MTDLDRSTKIPDVREQEPSDARNFRGTIFFMTVFLMMIFGFWALMYVELLNR